MNSRCKNSRCSCGCRNVNPEYIKELFIQHANHPFFKKFFNEIDNRKELQKKVKIIKSLKLPKDLQNIVLKHFKPLSKNEKIQIIEKQFKNVKNKNLHEIYQILYNIQETNGHLLETKNGLHGLCPNFHCYACSHGSNNDHAPGCV